MVYNNPATANVDMMPELIARIAQIPNCKYVKESTLDPTRVRDIIRLAGDRMTVFAGVLGYESFWLGAEGWVAVCSNVIPRWSAELFELVADKRDMDAALALYNKMTPLLWWVGGPRYVSGTKACFEMMGMPMGPPRAPRLPLPEAQRPGAARGAAGDGRAGGGEGASAGVEDLRPFCTAGRHTGEARRAEGEASDRSVWSFRSDRSQRLSVGLSPCEPPAI